MLEGTLANKNIVLTPEAYYAPRYLGDSRDEHDSFQGEMNNPRGKYAFFPGELSLILFIRNIIVFLTVLGRFCQLAGG